ncbi:MAG: DUF6197 family protein [Gemmatimonadaceae bacterium]
MLMTHRYASVMVLASLIGWHSPAHSQVTTAAAPTMKAAVGPFDVAIVKRAHALLGSPQRWNRADTGRCPRGDTTYSVRCALRRAVVEAAGLSWNPSAVAPNFQPSVPRVDCSMDVSAAHPGGSCGTLWDELPVFLISGARAITSGVWRKDAQPTEVWAGTMADAESPVNYESRHGVAMVSQRKSSDQLIEFNNDSATTFDDVRNYFRALEASVLQNGAADLERAADDVEIETYRAGNGIIRTYNGWYPVSGFSMRGSTIRFQIDTTKEIAPNALDREILVRATKILSSDSVWNRADNRKCPAAATKWSIYCAVEQAQIDVAGGFHHRRPAGELVREIVDERTKARNYNHRMMDYNNDPTTTLADVNSLFAEAIARIKP